ncbi:putative RND efflux membrane fusion protein [Acidisarcina polymorpha]|uniref:Putative RND efflux membrane fusion protein n=1 Tax=Acidisarcina polymorpha TaxID=2211140 RepID=A0A2Z5FU94_9BACT|nr:putative RND efflux membrane fusion protein [Acidisarcina polymorpha]
MLLAAGVFYSIRMLTRSRLPIRVALVQKGDIVSNSSTNGIVEPQVNFEAHAPYPGLVKAVYVHEGDKIKAGELLVAMNDSEARTRVAAALSGLRAAQASYDAVSKGGTQQERYTFAGDLNRTQADRDQAEKQLATLKKLVAQGSASPNEVAAAQQRLDQANASLHILSQRSQAPYSPLDLERAKAALADAQSAYDAAQQTLAQTTVRAPFAGTVYSLPVSATEFVQQGDRLLEVADLTKVQVRAYFDEPEIGQLAVGLPIKIVWDALPGRSWQGHISRVPSTVITYTTRHVGAAIVTVDNADGRLLPDTNVTVTVTTGSISGVLEIPREALHSGEGRDFVYVLDGEKLRRVPVKVGVNNLTAIQIVSGLQEGQTVAVGTTNGQPIVDGVPVKVVR